LIAIVFQLDAEIKVLLEDRDRLEGLLERSIERNEQRVDKLMGLDRKEVEETAQQPPRPIGRKSWNQTRAGYESKKREEYWTKKIDAEDLASLERRVSGEMEGAMLAKNEPEVAG